MGKINVRIIDEANGLRSISSAKAVRINSSDYNLLIMEDYAPTIGRMNGSLSILTEDDEICFSDVKGFYKLQKNGFTFLSESAVQQ